MSEWKTTDAYANNKPYYINAIGQEANTTNTYIADTILVTATRLANANTTTGVSSKQAGHTGWVNLAPQKGFIQNISVSNVNSLLVYTNTYLTITPSTGTNSNTAANASLVVVGGNNVSVVLNNTGASLIGVPTVTATGSNNTTLNFTVTSGGRLGRITSEVLVALSTPSSANATGAIPFYDGV